MVFSLLIRFPLLHLSSVESSAVKKADVVVISSFELLQ